MSNQFFNLAFSYLDACYLTQSQDKFEKIISKSVELKHQTNKEPVLCDQGRKKVMDFFKQYVLENTSEVNLKQFNVKEHGDGIVVKIKVEESKKDSYGKIRRFLFNETTYFHFKNKPGTMPKISMIDTKIQKTSLKSQRAPQL